LDKVIIAIDGQASTGKSTQAKKIADHLGFNYRDSGAYYRAITLYLLKSNVNHDLKISQEILNQISIKQDYSEGNFRIFLNDDNITNKIRGHKVSLSVSNFAKKPEIRKFVFDQLRNSAESNSIVVDGRDIGTVVFPDADFKFFLIAEPRIRAERRHKQIDDDSVKVDIIEEEIKIRDKTDSTREIAPLRKADDAFKIDVSDLTIDEVFNKILQKIKSD
jgi:cytidylate kinase